MKPNFSNRHDAVERILHLIENRNLDLTSPYENWVKLAFSLASLGESGRSYFHRLSRFHSEYDPSECDLQFSRCLASKGSGISLGTFFHLAKEAGIPISEFRHAESTGSKDADLDEFRDEKEPLKLPSLSEEVYENLPEFLKKAVATAESPEERDILLLGSMTVISACLPTIYGIYDGFEVYSNLYLYVTAAASSGKGKLNLCKRLVMPVHNKKRKEAEEMKVLYDSVSAEGDTAAEKPEKPKEKMLLLPANSSATGIFQLLADNDGRGLIFETEGDTLAITLRSDYGNYSDGYRKCYHHETISFYRRTDREYVDIQSPCLSTVLSGTPAQVLGLIQDAENGLFSRFLFYHLEMDLSWKDTFRNKNKVELLDYYHHLGQDFLNFYELLCKQPPIQVVLTDFQQERFYNFFRKIQDRYHSLLNDNFIATIRRMGLNCYRFMMVLSALRYKGMEELPHKIVCREEDFKAALSIVATMLQHSIYAFNRLPDKKVVDEKQNLRLALLRMLPPSFNSTEFLKKAAQMKISRSPAYLILKAFLREELVIKQSHNKYLIKENQDLWGEQFLTDDENPSEEEKLG